MHVLIVHGMTFFLTMCMILIFSIVTVGLSDDSLRQWQRVSLLLAPTVVSVGTFPVVYALLSDGAAEMELIAIQVAILTDIGFTFLVYGVLLYIHVFISGVKNKLVRFVAEGTGLVGICIVMLSLGWVGRM